MQIRSMNANIPETPIIVSKYLNVVLTVVPNVDELAEPCSILHSQDFPQ